MYDITNDVRISRVVRCNEFFTGMYIKSRKNSDSKDLDNLTFWDVLKQVYARHMKEMIEKTQK